MGAKPNHAGPVDLFTLSVSSPRLRFPSLAYNGTHQVVITGLSFVLSSPLGLPFCVHATDGPIGIVGSFA